MYLQNCLKHTCFENLTILLSTIRYIYIYILDDAARRLRDRFSIRKRYWSDFHITLLMVNGQCTVGATPVDTQCTLGDEKVDRHWTKSAPTSH